MDSKRSNKIREIVRLQQILKKWKKLANAPKNISGSSSSQLTTSGSSKSIRFLKRTLSFTDVSAASADAVPKGFLAVCVGKELKRFVIPTEYLGHQAFGVLLRKAEEEFGFQQEGVLKIPCEVSTFEKILEMVQHRKDAIFSHDSGCNVDKEIIGCYSPDCEFTPNAHHPQMCR
ncbi:SAUR-like auxin-responsive protein family, putative [Theobroma cacao]|uniref:SAUR-like auxin-responsive protein family, putative n=1 Tax=Theobroma cacao TaxID=3641 RepID=A0A061G9M8_THECC|nr:SAUR-like auxin-responsive protein family, putative [Theobroma cacao]